MNIDLKMCENLNKEEVHEFLNSVFKDMNPMELKYEWDLYINDMSSEIFFNSKYYDNFNNLTIKQLNENCDSKIALNYPKVKDLQELFNIMDENIDFTKIDKEYKKQKEKTLCNMLKETIMDFINELY